MFVDADGKLRQAVNGKLFDTQRARTLHSGDGKAIFVMDGNGNLYATKFQEMGVINHSSLVAGAPEVAGAGEIEVIEVIEGRMTVMTDRSGHYLPEPATNDRALEFLRSQGLQPADDFHKLDHNGQER